MRALRACCSQVQLTVGPNSFLGRGASGVVFQATYSHGNRRGNVAVKVSINSDAAREMESEFHRLQSLLCDLCVDQIVCSLFLRPTLSDRSVSLLLCASARHSELSELVIPATGFGKLNDGSAAWLVLAEVGQSAYSTDRIPNAHFESRMRKQIDAIFDQLAALHSLGIAHGDARLPNILYCRSGSGDRSGVWKWIDMRRPAGKLWSKYFSEDWLSLSQSIVHRFVSSRCALSEELAYIARHVSDFDESTERVHIDEEALARLKFGISTICTRPTGS